ncbi:MAG: helix-turn-helix transcriptional regulator [Mariprofundaceae bacterium]|nr:helix-turn-helix transcriptional regulator [Mariprofundaceae bacterium]
MMKENSKKEPYGNITSTEEIGTLVRIYRKRQSATQAELAALCAVGVRFISNLENGKPTLELGKVLHVLQCLGLDIAVTPRNWSSTRATLQNTYK